MKAPWTDDETPLYCFLLKWQRTYRVKHGARYRLKKNRNSEIPLGMASLKGYINIIKYLVEHGKYIYI